MVEYINCPCCSGEKEEIPGKMIFKCTSCGAVFGTLYRGDFYSYCSPQLPRESVPAEKWQYFDFVVLGGDGSVSRLHGWRDPETSLVHQWG